MSFIEQARTSDHGNVDRGLYDLPLSLRTGRSAYKPNLVLAQQWFKPSPIGESPIERLVMQSLLVRIHGLHRGIWQGLADDNPWQIWPLLRTMFELEVTMLYISRNPHLFDALSAAPSAARPNHPSLPGVTRHPLPLICQAARSARCFQAIVSS